MNFILLFIAIFSVILIFMYLWRNAIAQIFLLKEKLKPDSLAWSVTGGLLFLSFIAAIITILLIVRFIISVPYLFNTNLIGNKNDFPALAQKDCPSLLNVIYNTQNNQLENHRYIEEVAPLFTIKLEYKKGIDFLKSEADQYSKLIVEPETKYYTTKIAEKLRQKADLFEQRVQINLNQDKLKDVLNLLDEMDKVTKERMDLITEVKNQCQS